MVLTIAFLWFTFWISVAFLGPTASAARVGFFWNFVMGGKVQGLLAFQFVVFFVSRKVNLWEKLVLVAGYAFVAVTVWLPMAIDPWFLFSGPTLSTFGWGLGAGTGDAYLRPDGIYIFVSIMLALSFFLLIRKYRSEKSPLVRGQILYIVIGLAIIFAAAYQSYVQRALVPAGHYISIQNVISVPGDLILLLGLRKKGFYSITPVAETATEAVPLLYPLEDGRSYLAHDTRASFEAFTSLVQNGHEGLSITRAFPDQVRKDYGIRTTPTRWLAEERNDFAIPPGDLLGLSLTVKDFMKKAKNPVVIIQGLEYLTTYNGFTPILRLIQGLNEANATRRGMPSYPSGTTFWTVTTRISRGASKAPWSQCQP